MTRNVVGPQSAVLSGSGSAPMISCAFASTSSSALAAPPPRAEGARGWTMSSASSRASDCCWSWLLLALVSMPKIPGPSSRGRRWMCAWVSATVMRSGTVYPPLGARQCPGASTSGLRKRCKMLISVRRSHWSVTRPPYTISPMTYCSAVHGISSCSSRNIWSHCLPTARSVSLNRYCTFHPSGPNLPRSRRTEWKTQSPYSSFWKAVDLGMPSQVAARSKRASSRRSL
mmetsp:Transcript_154178/g.269707  ORF Transcript_154178/g.269707 Transcript_154178/m.269707 type:complete len:229 (-) Transcript_154178:292-978(-)